MKHILTMILLTISFAINAQISTALPISFSDVCLEIYGSSSTSGRSLAQAHTDATGTFDVTYDDPSGDTLLEFRGYNHSGTVTWKPFTVSLIGQTTSETSCADLTGTTRYHNGGGSYPTIGDSIAFSSSGSPLFNGFAKWYYTGDNSTILIQSTGLVSAKVFCNDPQQ